MTIDLYTCTADPRERDKSNSLTQIGTSVTISPTSTLDVAAPQIIIDYSENLISANYGYIPLFGKYYFLDPPKVQPGKRIVFQGRIDYLMTYREALLMVPATVIRSEYIGLNDVPDRMLPINPNGVEILSALGSKAFQESSYSLDAASVVLITGRGKSNGN